MTETMQPDAAGDVSVPMRPPGERIEEIEVLRAFGIAMVLVEHIPLNLFFWHSGLQDVLDAYWHGTAGVDLFFAISGFVIARQLLPKLAALPGGTAYFAETLTFFLRRFWRLQPSAWLWIAIPLLLSIVFNRSAAFRQPQVNVASGLTALTLISNLRYGRLFYGQDAGINFPYWSLSLEEQFYLLLPLAVLVFRRRLVLLMLALLAFQFLMPQDSIYIFTRPGAIAAGVLLAIWNRSPYYSVAEPRFLATRRLVRACFLIACLALMGALMSALAAPLSSVPRGLVAVLSAILVYAASFGEGYTMAPGLLRQGMIWLGTRSFAIYLIHIPAYALTHELYFRYGPPVYAATNYLAAKYLVTGLALTLVLAEINYRWLETPCRRYGRTLRLQARAEA